MPTNPRPDTRRSERISFRESVMLFTKVQGKESLQTVSSVDLSKHGLRVLVNRPLEQGQVVYAMPDTGGEAWGYCRVIWVHPAALNGREKEQAGLEFVSSESPPD